GGLGVLAVDGRTRQPGAGAHRPRGFVESESIPDAAWVAAPSLHAALAATNALARTLTLTKTLGPALDLAKSLSEPRAKVLKAISRAGALAFKEPDLASQLPLMFGKLEGGL